MTPRSLCPVATLELRSCVHGCVRGCVWPCARRVLVVDLRMGTEELHVGDVSHVLAAMQGQGLSGPGPAAALPRDHLVTFQQFCNFLAPDQLAAGMEVGRVGGVPRCLRRFSACPVPSMPGAPSDAALGKLIDLVRRKGQPPGDIFKQLDADGSGSVGAYVSPCIGSGAEDLH
jgi:hypothetical protein